MDPASSDSEISNLQCAFTIQGNLLGQHGQTPATLAEQNQALLKQVTQLLEQYAQLSSFLAAQPQPESAAVMSYTTDPALFTGDLGQCRGFLLHCHMVFNQ